MTCANCSEAPLYIYRGSGVRETLYCYACLPSFLRTQAKAGVLPTTGNFDVVRERVQEQLKPATDEEPVVVDDTIEEFADAPKRRPRKTATAEESPLGDVEPTA